MPGDEDKDVEEERKRALDECELRLFFYVFFFALRFFWICTLNAFFFFFRVRVLICS